MAPLFSTIKNFLDVAIGNQYRNIWFEITPIFIDEKGILKGNGLSHFLLLCTDVNYTKTIVPAYCPYDCVCEYLCEPI